MLGQIARHTRIHHREIEVVLMRQHIDGRAAALLAIFIHHAQHIRHHLRRHSLRIGRYALIDDAVIPRKHHNLRLLQAHHLTALDQPELNRQRFQLPQRAERLGFVIQLVLQLGRKLHGGQAMADRRDLGRLKGGLCHVSFSRKVGKRDWPSHPPKDSPAP